MRNLKEINRLGTRETPTIRPSEGDALASELETNGFVVLPNLLKPEQLRGIQQAFEARLRRMRWNNFDGYHKDRKSTRLNSSHRL